MRHVQSITGRDRALEWKARGLIVALVIVALAPLTFHGCATAPASTLDINTPAVEYAP